MTGNPPGTAIKGIKTEIENSAKISGIGATTMMTDAITETEAGPEKNKEKTTN